jgi:hypothetical protein
VPAIMRAGMSRPVLSWFAISIRAEAIQNSSV